MWKHGCRLSIALIAICLSVASGCGPSSRVVEGTVTLDGKPLASGAIEFEPASGSGRLLGADITAGSYRIEVPADQAQGKYIVRIISPQPTGRKIAAGPPAVPGTMIDEIAEAVPAQYNTSSTLQADVSSTAPHDFQLSSAAR